jgi:hypothetical protein
MANTRLVIPSRWLVRHNVKDGNTYQIEHDADKRTIKFVPVQARPRRMKIIQVSANQGKYPTIDIAGKNVAKWFEAKLFGVSNVDVTYQNVNIIVKAV